MTQAQEIWAALILAQFIVSSPIVIYLLKGTQKMPVLPEFQTALDELNASVSAIQALKLSVEGAVSAQDVADTQAAVQAAADAVKAAAGQ